MSPPAPNGHWMRAAVTYGRHFVPSGSENALCGKAPTPGGIVRWYTPRHADKECAQCAAILKQVST